MSIELKEGDHQIMIKIAHAHKMDDICTIINSH